jgi:hypothetical protein
MQDKELKPAEQTQNTLTPVSDHSLLGGGPTTSDYSALSDADLRHVAGGPTIRSSGISTITELADEDLRQVAGGPTIHNTD